jgi:hypothetical protein
VSNLTSLNKTFDTVLLLGNNFGILQNRTRAKQLLKMFHKTTSPRGIIIAESSDPYKFATGDDKRYAQKNQKQGRMAGQRRIRIRFRQFVSGWFDYLGVSQRELRSILIGTGWKIERVFDSERKSFIAILKKSAE